MSSPELDYAILESRRSKIWSYLGTTDEDRVVSRLVPGSTAWPRSVLGRQRIIRRPSDVLLFTDGLSDPYDPTLHVDAREAPLDFELGLALRTHESDAQIGHGIWPQLLYALADFMVEEYVDLRPLLTKFTCITTQAIIGRGFGQGFERDGLVGYLIGMPLDGADFSRQLYVDEHYRDLPVAYAHCALGLFPVRVLRPSELDWAIAQGNTGALRLAEAFLERGDGCLNDLHRPPLF